MLTTQVPVKLGGEALAFQYCTDVTFADHPVGRLKLTGSNVGAGEWR